MSLISVTGSSPKRPSDSCDHSGRKDQRFGDGRLPRGQKHPEGLNVRSERGGQRKLLQHSDRAGEDQARVSSDLVVAPHGSENLLGKIDANPPRLWLRLIEVVSLDEGVANSLNQEKARKFGHR